jgi:isoleucyl-tRNA synthetase
VREGYAKYDFQGVFQKLFAFCTTDLSAVYFDIRKDALYCDAPSSLRRRACRTVMDLLFHRLTTWLAPILVFTMEEVWLERFPGEESSVHLVDFPETPKAWLDKALAAKWDGLRDARRVVTGALELQRTAKAIGSSLEAAPVVFTDKARLGIDAEEFAELCITSGLEFSQGQVPDGAFTLPDVPGIAVEFRPAGGAKCERCWKVLPDVGTHKHPGTCRRCNDALG